MKKNRLLAAASSFLAASLLLAGCAGGGSSTEATGEVNPGAVITANGTEPTTPLIPTMSNEPGGGKVLTMINSTLVYYDANGATHNELAESITPNEDATEWTIKIKPGQKFSDDTEIKADNFIKAWNYGANPKNGHLSGYFFEPIEGFSADEGADVEELSGLQKVDDYTFTVKLSAPTSDFGLRLGYWAFAPLPDVAFEDIEAYGENPLASGPYMVAENGWEHNVKIDLVPNPSYDGPRKAQNGGITLQFYSSLDSAYNDLLANNLDVLDTIPDSAFGTYQSDLDDRSVNQPSAALFFISIPMTLEHFTGDEGKLRRKAISMAFDRDEITQTIFAGTRTPASDFTSPVIDGWTDEVPGNEVLKYDPEKAKELWAEADVISPWSGTFEFAYDADGGHQAWVEAVVNQITNNLGIDAVAKPYPTFKDMRQEVTAGTINAAFRTRWGADYPATFNFLGPIYSTNGGSNNTGYSNPEFDALLAEGSKQTSVEEANKYFIEAQTLLFEDMPTIPLWYPNVVAGWSESVSNVQFAWNSDPLYYQFTKN